MKNTGITRDVDSAGRIVLPMELRRNMGIEDGTPMGISVDGSNIVLSPAVRALTPEELEARIDKPVFCKDKKTGVRFWIIVDSVFADEVCGKNDEFHEFCTFDFYDKEV